MYIHTHTHTHTYTFRPPVRLKRKAATDCKKGLVACLPYSSTVRMEAKLSSDRSVNFYQTTRHNIPDHRTSNLTKFIKFNSKSCPSITKNWLRISNYMATSISALTDRESSFDVEYCYWQFCRFHSPSTDRKTPPLSFPYVLIPTYAIRNYITSVVDDASLLKSFSIHY
jgi:hypothetical protein